MKRSLRSRVAGPERALLAPLALPLATCFCAVWLLSGCNSGGESNSAVPAPTPESTEVPSAITPAPSPTAPPKPNVLASIFVPGADGKLTVKPVPPAVLSRETRGTPSALPALDTILLTSPKFFPPGTQIKSIHATPKLVTMDLSEAFDDQDFWSTTGESMTQVAVYALVDSAATIPDASGDTGPRPVQFTCAGKPITTLGEFDASDALPFDKTLVNGS